MIPNDPMYRDQWHLTLLGDIETIWDDYTGLGVHVGVYDSGVDLAHPDLRSHYDASRHVTVNGRVLSGGTNDASTSGQNHGTSVAGLIGGVGNNGIGVVGTGWNSILTSVNIFDSTSAAFINSQNQAGFFSAIHQMTKFDVTNNSWGSKPSFDNSYQNLNVSTSFAAKLDAEYAYVSANGRGGLGTVICQAAGNETVEANGAGTNASRYSLTVAAAREDGFASSYSNQGACVLIAAPGSESDGSILTTDRSGRPGYTTGDYNPTFNGTSAATPIVSGVVALMLEANANLGWRDVQTILAASAHHTGSAIGAGNLGTNEESFWQINGAGNWNGGGMHFSNDYGYGMLDAYNAVRMAEAWKYFSPGAQTSANEIKFSTGDLRVFGNNVIPDGSYLNVTFDVSASLILEHADINITFQHGNFNYLNIYAYSPDGTRILLHDGTAGEWNVAANGLTWTFGIDSLRGEAVAGRWTIQFVDTFPEAANGYVTSVGLTGYGTAPITDDVYHYTDEFADLSDLQSERLTLDDTDGGVDWIDASAVTGACFVNLGAGGQTTIAGKSITMGIGLIENAVTGDGDDVLIANGAANTLVGGRGNDTYLVDSATDTVIETEGQGSDTLISSVSYRLAAGTSIETLLAANKTGTAAIDLSGNALANALQGTNGSNQLDGGAGADTMTGFGGNDVYLVDNARDRVVEAADAGTDTVRSSVTFTLSANVEALILTGRGDVNGTGNALANTLTGNSGANVLDGGSGKDRLVGGAGDDTYVTDGNDTIKESSASGGTDLVRSSTTFSLGANLENLTLTGSSASSGSGNNLANTLVGNSGSNILAGNGGGDALYGRGGGDTFLFKTVSDSTVSAAGRDTIQDFSAAQGDRIDLHLIDAVAGGAVNQAFRFIGSADFHDRAGELRAVIAKGNTLVTADVDGDGSADLSILLKGTLTLHAADFIL